MAEEIDVSQEIDSNHDIVKVEQNLKEAQELIVDLKSVIKKDDGFLQN